MSIDATRWAWQQPVKANQKIVLLSLADRAGENHDCYPSIKRLAQDCGMSRSALFANLEELEKLGLIKRINRSSEKSGTISNIYQLIGVDDRKIMPIKTHQPPVQNLNTPRPESGLPPVQNLDYPPSRIWTTPVQNLDTEPSINHQYINNNNNETISSNNHAINAHELLLSLNFEETTPTLSKALSSEQKERQKEEGVLLPLSGLNERQAKEASKKLAQLSPDQREIAIMMFNQTAELGRIRKPMALVNQLVNLGLNNELEPPLNAFNQNPNPNPNQELKTHSEANNEASNEDYRRETTLEFLKLKVTKYKDKMLAEYKQKRAVFIQGLGVFYQDDLAAAGLFD